MAIMRPGPGKPPKKAATPAKPATKTPAKPAAKTTAKPAAKKTALKVTANPRYNVSGTTLKAVQGREKESIEDKRSKVRDQWNASYSAKKSAEDAIKNLKGSKRMSRVNEDAALDAVYTKRDKDVQRLSGAFQKIDDMAYAQNRRNEKVNSISVSPSEIKNQTLKGQKEASNRSSSEIGKNVSKAIKAEMASARMQKGAARRTAMENAISKYDRAANMVDSVSSREYKDNFGARVKPGTIKPKRK